MRLCICECYGPFLLESGSQRSRPAKEKGSRASPCAHAQGVRKVQGLGFDARRPCLCCTTLPSDRHGDQGSHPLPAGWPWGGSAANREPPACKQLRAKVTMNSKYALLCRKGGEEKREDVRPLTATHSPCGQAVNPGRAVPPAGLPR